MLEQKQALLSLVEQYLSQRDISTNVVPPKSVDPSQEDLTSNRKFIFPNARMPCNFRLIGDAMVAMESRGDDSVELHIASLPGIDVKEMKNISSVLRPLARAALESGHYKVGEVVHWSHFGARTVEEYVFSPRPISMLIDLLREQIRKALPVNED